MSPEEQLAREVAEQRFASIVEHAKKQIVGLPGTAVSLCMTRVGEEALHTFAGVVLDEEDVGAEHLADLSALITTSAFGQKCRERKGEFGGEEGMADRCKRTIARLQGKLR